MYQEINNKGQGYTYSEEDWNEEGGEEETKWLILIGYQICGSVHQPKTFQK